MGRGDMQEILPKKFLIRFPAYCGKSYQKKNFDKNCHVLLKGHGKNFKILLSRFLAVSLPLFG